MNKEKLIIIGGVAAGASAAAKARRTNEHIKIKIFEKNGYVSYANCGLPYYIGGTINKRKSLLLHTTKTLGKRFNADILVNHEVLEIDAKRKVVSVRNDEGVFEESFDKLIIATGSKPVIPDIEGIEDVPYFQMRTVEDVDAIKRFLEEKKPESVAIIGGGYIGVEVAEAMLHCGLMINVIEMAPYVLPGYSPEIALTIEERMKEEGVKLFCGRKVKKVVFENEKYRLFLDGDEFIDVDMLFLATGVKPNVEIAKNTGIELGETGGILTNSYMQTNYDYIFAAGDAVEKLHLISGKKVLFPLAGPANREGRVAGCNAAGGILENPGIIGTSVVGFFDKVVAKTGLSFKEALEAGFDADYVYTEDPDHAEYYPGFKYIYMKTVYDKKSKRVLGVEASGSYDAVRKVDVIATALYGGLTIYDLENIDFCYAPPFGSARDNINKAGFVAANQDRGEGYGIKPDYFLDLMMKDDSLQVIDVRTKLEYNAYRIDRAKNIYVNDIRDKLDEIDKTRPVYLYCAVGFRGYLATRFLRNLGYEAYNVLGGIESIIRFKNL
ncbi:pyridine nucleotide-disulfide oxidoreductase [Deferribacter autotrophicus]|uniref:Pyridine nucleotide-disulfide oxidoreductase n=1 Tax=Deferribacter autotrophicus TaxID=500465 RepID=A0A5A8F5K8_9BACT|nr:FAD-dependent oxidoreductase [Deferribacter autotrophicus]KAA0258674.1 pyridine nucleotide-disulfide oxidoreductase [Deferribacter autotrophicus]